MTALLSGLILNNPIT